jgi:hypothetical protein
MRSVRRILPAVSLAALTAVAAAATGHAGPSAAFGALDRDEHARLEAGAAVVTVVAAHGVDVEVLGAARVNADGDRLADWVREIERYQQGQHVVAIGRFSDPPVLEDLAALSLDEQDLKDLRACRPGGCGLKLSAGEIVAIRQAISIAGPGWKPAAQDTFRRLLLARAHSYLAGGFAVLPAYADDDTPVSPASEAAAVLHSLSTRSVLTPEAEAYLRAYPHAPGRDVESFLYWSRETLGGGKPIVSITHVAIVPSRGEARGPLVVNRQVYATHYLTGSLSLSLVAGGGTADRYLVYVRRSRADVFGGTFGGLVRRVVTGRIRADGPGVLDGMRRRLESGPPRDGGS